LNIDLKNIHILVVEDIQPMRDLLSHMLGMLGVGRVTLAQNGADAYRKYISDEPDIIITDWQMPEMDGFEFVKKVRIHKDSPNRTIPIIMMTGFCAHQRISLARDNGATEFLVKPFSAEDMAKRISHIIQSPRDFIIAQNFIGPDRRRKKDGKKDTARRKKAPHKVIKASDKLKIKTGIGSINQILIDKSQKILDENEVDFVPIMNGFLSQLGQAIAYAKQEEEPTRKALDDIIDPIMQIKANARIFKYDLVGNLADIVLTFLEQLNNTDQYIFEIVGANQKTLKHLVSKKVKGNGGDVGPVLENELESACNRYMNTKAQISQNTLKNKTASK